MERRAAKFIAVIAAMTTFLGQSVQAQQATSKCTSRAERFVQAFGPIGTSETRAMRAQRLVAVNYIAIALDAIDKLNAGKGIGADPPVRPEALTEFEVQRLIDNYNDLIRTFLADNMQDIERVSAAGRMADLASIARAMQMPLGVARQDQLSGHEEAADAAQKRIVNVLTSFSSQFAQTCTSQSYDVRDALGLERQNQLMGTGISLAHCINQKMTADVISQGVIYHFENCTYHPYDNWQLTISGRVTGNGLGANPVWHADGVLFNGSIVDAFGDFELRTETIEPDPPAAPQPLT